MDNIVSIIMPVYNGERFIAEAIDSVLAQTYPHWELIVVNDGSTDGTSDILVGYSDLRIRCIHQDNKGLAGARNAGIEEAQGEYLAFLDADDAFAPEFLARCLETLSCSPDAAGVYTGNFFIGETGAVLPRKALHVVESKRLHNQLIRGGFILVCSLVVYKDAVKLVGMFDTNLAGQGMEDWDLWLRLSAQYRLEALPELLTYYRVYPGSMSTNADRMHACRISVLAKHFGSEDGDSRTWPENKRIAYGYGYRALGLDLLAHSQTEAGWQALSKAATVYPPLLSDLSTYYELACGDQPRGYRGVALLLDIEANSAEMLRRLDALFAEATAPVQALRGAAFGNAYLALAMLSDQAGDWVAARRYLLLAARHNPRLVSGSFVRRLAKVSAGKRAVGLLKSWRSPAVSEPLPSSSVRK